MKIKTELALILICCLLTACYKDINMEKYRPEPTMVLNCILSPDTTVMAQVSKTVFFTDYQETDPIVSDAEVKLYANGAFIEEMKYNEKSRMYTAAYRPSAGEMIHLEASSQIGNVSGEGIVPEAVPIEKVTLTGHTFDDPDQIIWTPDGPAYGKSYEVTYHITFNDNPSTRNFYFIRIEGENGLAAETLDYSHDDVFQAQQSSIDGVTTDTGIYGNEGRTFTDELINGGCYTLKIVEKAPLYTDGNESRPRRIILYSLSEAYYHYLTGIFNSNEESVSNSLIELGFAEPSPHYTNIIGGTGIVGAVQTHAVRTDLKSIINQFNQ